MLLHPFSPKKQAGAIKIKFFGAEFTGPAGARVGTVDKFQGQEAAVLLVSMTSSSAEEVSRGLEFLYSRNRLNVAVSRAKCLALVVASPKLLEASCTTIEQMRLVNMVCFVSRYRAESQQVQSA